MRIGIYPGTFDPVHNGHVALALKVLEQCDLDRIIFLPEASPRGKEQVTAVAHRSRMLELATADQERVSVMNLKSPQFTVAQTLPELKGLFPAAELALILGSDVALSLGNRWPDLEVLLAEMELIVAVRDGENHRVVEAMLHMLPGARYTLIRAPQPAASSSAARIARGMSTIPPVIASYITTHKLYM